MTDFEQDIKELEQEIAELIYNKLRIYSNLKMIKFDLDYEYVMTTKTYNSVLVKKENEWRYDLIHN